MKTLERYVFGSFLSSFILAFLVLSFVLTVGLMVQIVGFILDGVPMSLILEFAGVSFPETLQWTMPLALLVSSVLVFSRMSADSEIAAMRACGVHLLSVMKWPILFAFACTLLGMVVNNEVVPRGHLVRRSLKNKVTVRTGLDVLEPGRVINDFPNVKVYFGGKEGNWIRDLVVVDYSTPGVNRVITASKALVTSQGRDISLDLYNMTVDPLDAEHPTMARASRFQYVVKDALRDSKYMLRDKDYRFFELLGRIRRVNATLAQMKDGGKNAEMHRHLLQKELANAKTELSKRIVFAMASICFVLIGIPLGIKAQRKESTVGMAISLGISLGYYMLVILMLGFEDHYELHPEIFLWLPVALCLAIGARVLPKNL